MSVVGWSVSVAELVQKTDIIFIERPDIVNAVAEHRNPVNAHTECIPGHLFGIEIHSPEDVGIHHAGSQYFKPLPLFTASPPDIHLDTGFCKREEGGSHTVPDIITVHQAGKHNQCLDQLTHGDSSVYIESLHLIELEVGLGSYGFVPVDSAGHHRSDWGAGRLHKPDLYGGCVGPHHQIITATLLVFTDEERVLHVPGRMIRGKIESGKVVKIVFNFGSS